MVSLLTHALKKFYSVRENADVLESVVDGKAPVSIKLVNWYVKAYLPAHDRKAYSEYMSYASAYRSMFEPFRRKHYVVLDYCDRTFETTVGQMNFYRWMIESGHWEYVIANSGKLARQMVLQPLTTKAKVSRKDAKDAKDAKDDIVAKRTVTKSVVLHWGGGPPP